MEDKVSQKVICTECGKESDDREAPCPNCGSKKKTIKLLISDHIELHDKIRARTKHNGISGYQREIIKGDEFSVKSQKFVEKERIIDKKDDHYFELVRDKQTGDIIHSCDEKLSQHVNHGSAKVKKDESD